MDICSGTSRIVSSAGIANSLLRASHLTRITHAYKMTALKFAKITCAAFSNNLKKYTVHDEANEKGRQGPTFYYYNSTMELSWVLFS